MAPGELSQPAYLDLTVSQLQAWDRSDRGRARRQSHQLVWSAAHNQQVVCGACGTASPPNLPAYCIGDLTRRWAQRRGFTTGDSDERRVCYLFARRVLDIWGIRATLPACVFDMLRDHFPPRPPGDRAHSWVDGPCRCRCRTCKAYHGDPAIWPNPPGAVANAAAAAAAPAPAPAPAAPAPAPAPAPAAPASPGVEFLDIAPAEFERRVRAKKA